MMNEYWKTKKFSILKKKWEKILLESGFNDIEEDVHNDRKLKQYSSNAFRFNYNKEGMKKFTLNAGGEISKNRVSLERALDNAFECGEEEKTVVYYRSGAKNFLSNYLEAYKLHIESRQLFFDLVTNSLNKDKEMKEIERIIMQGYSEGLSQKKIISELKRGGLECNRITITRTISRYLTKWKIPTLKPRKTR